MLKADREICKITSGNASYNSHRIISEWLDVMSQVIEGSVLEKFDAGSMIGLLADNSTYLCDQ